LKADIIALQETHAREQDHRSWNAHWNGPAAWTPHVGLLLRKDSGLAFVSDPVSLLEGHVLAAKVTGDAPLLKLLVHELLACYIRKIGSVLSNLYGQLPRDNQVFAMGKEIPTFWQCVIMVWNRLNGCIRNMDDSWHPLEVLTMLLRYFLRRIQISIDSIDCAMLANRHRCGEQLVYTRSVACWSGVCDVGRM
jgi:hypothetical protein